MLHQLLQQTPIHPVIKLESGDKIAAINFSPTNTELTADVVQNTETFCQYINKKLADANAKFLIGGYGERREIYRRSELFDDDANVANKEEPRNIHLGIDVWGAAGTPVFSPLAAIVHSFAFNDHFGDYGATIILQHTINNTKFHTLYGHLSKQDLDALHAGKPIEAGELVAHFGPPAENGHWPPHLHFQIIQAIGTWQGDYPGVCKTSEKDQYLKNCPNPDVLMQLCKLLQ